MAGGISTDLANAFAKIADTAAVHPFASIGAGLFIILLVCVRKEGLASKYLQYLGERASRDAALEMRRLAIIEMLEERDQLSLPGIEQEEDQKRK